MEKTFWKILAIIFVIIIILESWFIVYSYNLGIKMIERENECSYNTCNDYDSYYYDDYEQICYCYLDGEVKYQEYIK